MTNINKPAILIIAPAWVGDMVMSQVLLKCLKQSSPQTAIDVLAPTFSQLLFARMPEVRCVFSMPIGHGQLGLKKRWQLGQALAKKNYSQAIVLPNSWKSAIIPWAARIPKRTGWLGEQRWLLLNDIRHLNKSQLPLMIQRFFALGLAKDKLLPRDLPYPSLQICPEQLSSTLAKFHLANLNQPLLVLCPGAEYGPAKRWPAKHYAEIARAKHAIGWQVWLLGSAKDQKVAAEIQQLSNGVCQDLTGKTDMGEAIDLLSLASLVVTNDSGLMHVAAALDRPIIALYGSSSAHFTPPLSNKAKILSLNLPCSPCFKRECPLEHFECLNKLLPAQVLKAADELQVI